MFHLLLILSTFIFSSHATLIQAIDSSTAISESDYTSIFAMGYTRAIIRGYDSACDAVPGGDVNQFFVSSYNNAQAAGFTDIQTYWLPCNGQGNNCKAYDIQLRELSETIALNQMDIELIWVDFEQDPDCPKNWNYGPSENQVHAQSMLNAIQTSGLHFGIYSSEGEWTTLFGSKDFILDNSVPVWFSTFGTSNNNNSNLEEISFGGWTVGMGQQYHQASASEIFDRSVFSS